VMLCERGSAASIARDVRHRYMTSTGCSGEVLLPT
jgi:hypothetical protein